MDSYFLDFISLIDDLVVWYIFLKVIINFDFHLLRTSFYYSALYLLAILQVDNVI